MDYTINIDKNKHGYMGSIDVQDNLIVGDFCKTIPGVVKNLTRLSRIWEGVDIWKKGNFVTIKIYKP